MMSSSAQLPTANIYNEAKKTLPSSGQSNISEQRSEELQGKQIVKVANSVTNVVQSNSNIYSNLSNGSKNEASTTSLKYNEASPASVAVLSNKKPMPQIQSLSSKLRASSIEQDESYLENVLNAKDRRASWQQVRSQKSYVPSLSAICKLHFIFVILVDFFSIYLFHLSTMVGPLRVLFVFGLFFTLFSLFFCFFVLLLIYLRFDKSLP
jgi:hypothetical protein